MLTRLRHGAVCSGDNQDRAVHLRGAGDHVLDVVSVTRAVNVGVVTVAGLVLDVGGGDRYASRLLLGSVVDLVKCLDLAGAKVIVEHLADGGRQRRLAMVDVTDGPDVHMGFIALELGLSHFGVLLTYLR